MAEIYRCRCCELRHNSLDGRALCTICRYHQSKEIQQTAKRHSDHVDMLRVRLTAASEWAEKAGTERDEAREKMQFAYKSRDRTISVLRQVNDMHELRPDGSCKCRMQKGCKIGKLLDDRGIRQLIQRVDEYEDNMRQRQRMWEELRYTDDDSDDDFQDDIVYPPARAKPLPDADTA